MKIADMLLAYLHTHPNSYTLVNTGYRNVVTFTLPDTVIFPYHQILFPSDRLNAFRVADDFIPSQRQLVAWLGALIDPSAPTHPRPTAIWLTLSRLAAADRLMIEVSFE